MILLEKKIITKSEQKNLIAARKSIVAIECIKKGDKFSEKNLGIKRPGSGISPMKWRKILGKFSKRNYKIDQLIKLK